ncbi:MAG: copper amine oxidase N-terminal domain-containing protein, partial [Clostridiales bacterium]|nr:copper amine oxidase N-terminal domain-containing protein [Clostridiales bacterium]
MKKSVASKAVTAVAGLSVLCLLTLALVGAAPPPAVDAIKVIVNGKDIRFPDAQPFIDSNGRTQVPMRFVAEAMGAEVEWTQSAER